MNQLKKEEKRRKREQKRREKLRRRRAAHNASGKARAAWLQFRRYRLRRARKFSYHILAFAVVAAVALLGFVRAPGACLRFWESVRDLGASIFGSSSVTTLPYGMTAGFPQAVEEFGAMAKNFFALFISKENFLSYLSMIGQFLLNACYALTYALLPAALVFVFALVSIRKRNRLYGRKSGPLKAFLCVRRYVFLPVARYIGGFWRFFRRRKKYFITSVLIALFFLNAYAIVLEALAYYFFFLLSETFTPGFGSQIVKLAYDLFMGFRFLPIWAWGVAGIKLFDIIRKEIGYRLLEKHEEDLRKFLDERGVNILICGAPRMGKTTTLVSIVKSLMAMSRQNAKRGMRDLNRKFPDFPWIVLEKMIRKDYDRRVFRNLSHLGEWLNEMIENGKHGGRVWLRRLKRRYRSCVKAPFENCFFNYDLKRFKTEYDGGLGKESIEEAVRDYAALYLIYIQPMLVLANFSIRSDNDFADFGNFPEWRDDFFRHEPDPVFESRFAKVLNQDLLRPGKQLDPRCEYKDCFEFGVIAETEVGKERGNQFDREGKSKKDENANVLNDRRDDLFKLMGHLGTVYNLRFALYVGDEQRASSWSANAMELCDVLTIKSRGKEKILMPFFGVEELLYLIVHKLFARYYDEVRFNRGDTTLTTYLLSHLSKAVEDHYAYIKNKFGGHSLKVSVVSAMKQDGDKEAMGKGKIFISDVKVYSHVFRTAAWNKFMEKRAEKSALGLEDIPEFGSLDASYKDFKEMRSYFFTELVKIFDKQEEQESALEYITRTVGELYKAIAAILNEKRANELLGQFCNKLPQMIKAEDFEKMKANVQKQREIFMQTAWKEREANKAKEEKEGAERGKTKKAAAAAN